MAKGLNKPIDVKANLSLDTSQAKAQLKMLQRDIGKITQNIGTTQIGGLTGITSELTTAIKATSQLQSALKGATNEITGNLDLTKFNDSLRRAGTTLTDYRQTLQSLGSDGTKAFNDLNKAILSAETPMLRTTQAAKETLTTLGNTVRWQATSSLIHGVMGAASQAMSYVQRLDKSLNSIQIVTGKSADTMANFAKQANEAAKNLSTTTNEYAKAALIYYQQGLSDSQVAGRVETTLKLANVSGQTAAKVSDQMTSIWNNFYNGSKSLEYYADVMTALGASTATSSKEIAQGLSKFSSIAKTTGLSYEYATSALATITAATRQSADSVGTSLKTMFSRLQGLSLGNTLEDGTTLNKYSKALLAIGVNIKEANGQLKSMDSILNEIGNKWQTLNKDTQIALAQTVGGVRNYTSLMTLMNNWDQFRTNVGTARMAGGTLQKQADIYADSWEAAQARVRAASESIYKNLIDDKVFKGMTNNLASTLETVGKVTDAMGGFKGVLLSTAGVATQLFGGEISQALGNVGYNISSVLGGQKEVQALRQEALRNLLTPSNRLDTIVGEVETALNKNLVDRLTTYQEKVNKGQIAEWQTAAYQQLLQKAAEQDERTLAAVQAATQAETISSRYGYTFQQSLRTAANNISDAAMKNAAEDFLQGSGKYKNAGGRQTYEALEDIAKTSIVLEELNSKYESAIPSEKGIASSTAAMKSLAGTILQLGSGAKELNISFQDLVGDKDTAIQLEHLYNNLNDFIAKTGPVTEQNLRKYQDFFEDRFGDFGNTLQKAIDNSAYGGQGFSNQLGELQSQLVSSFGMTAEQAASVVADVRARSEAVGESSLSRVMNVGASAESNKAIMDQLNANTRKHMDISQAVTDQIALFTSSAAAYGTVVQTLNTLTSGSASAMDRIVALGTSFGTLKSAMSAAGNVFSNFNSQIDIFGKSSPLTVGGLTAISGAAVGLVELGQSAIQAYQDTTVESQIKTLQNATVLAKEQASIAVETYNTLTAGAANYSALIDELYALKPGTADFANTLLAANDAALALTDKYGLTASRGAYGEIVFDSQELRERTKEYEQAAIEAQTRSLISSQYAQFFETAATYDRLNHTILWDSQNNIDTMKQDLSNQMKGFAGKMADSLGLNKGLLGSIGNNISSLFTNFTNQILIGADTLVTDMTKAGFLDNQIYETYQNLRSGTSFKTEEALLNKNGLFTMDKLAQFYAEGIENGTFSSYQEFREKYKIGEATLGYVQPTDWSGLVESISEGGTGAIHWGEAKERLGQMLSNIAPQSLQSIIDGALGLGPNATDEDRQEAMQNFAKTSENAQRAVEASIANMVSSVVASGEDYTTRQQMAAAILGAGGYSTLSQIRPEDLETLQKQSPDVLRAQYKKLINPLTTDYLNYSSDELIAGIQAAQIEGKIKSAIDKIALGEITEEDLALARNYQNMSISELVNPENNTGFWGTFYAQQAANSISQLGETLIQSLTPEQLQQSFGNIFSSEFVSNFEGNFAKAFGNALTEWVSERGFSIEDVKTLTSWTGAAKGTFGQQTADYVFSALTTGAQGGLNATTQRALRAVNFENSLAGLSQLKNLKNSVTDKSLEQTLNNLYDRMLGDIGGESGLFSKLWNSSDFAKVAASLESVYQQTGTISASLVQALSSKSESLRDYLGATSLSNAGGLAATMRAIYSGTIEQTEVTTSLIQSLGMAYGGTGTQASRQEEIKNFDFEDSSANLINKWLKSAGQGVKAGWNAGYLADPATMQIINMLPQSTQMAYYQSMRGGLSDQSGAKTILQSFKSADPAAATFLTKLQSGKAQIADVMAYLKAETGLFSDTDSLFSWTPNGLVLKGSAKELFGENGEFGEYGQYLKDNYKEFVKPNGELNVEYLFNSAPGYQRLLEDYLKGKIPTKGATSYLDNASSEFWGNMITEWTASGGAAPQWDVEGVANALDNYEMLGFASDAEFRAFVQEAILNNPNPLVRNIAGVDNYDDYVKWFKQNSAGNFQVLSKDYWSKSENLIGDFGKIIGSNYDHFNWLMESEGATLKDPDGNKIGTDFNKAVQVLMSKMDMTRDQAIDALNTYGAVLDHLGGYVYENGTAIFTTYQEWLLTQGKTHSRENLEEFSKLLSDNSIENSIEKYVSDLMAGVKEALGITADTTEVEKQIQNYLNIFGEKGPAAGIGAFLDDVWKESALGRAVQGAVTGVKKFFKGMAEGVINFFTGNNWNYYFDDTVGQGFGTFLQDTFTGIIDDLKDGAPKIAGLISNIFGLGKFENLSMGGQNIFRFTDKDGNQIITDSMSEVWKNIGSIISSNVAETIGNALSLLDGILENWNFTGDKEIKSWEDVKEAVSNLGSQAWSRITKGLSNLIAGTEYKVDEFGNILDAEGNPVELSEVWSGIGKATWEGIKGFFTKTVPDFFGQVNDFFFGAADSETKSRFRGKDLAESFGNLGKHLLGGALNGLNKLLGSDQSLWGQLGDEYETYLPQIWGKTKEAIVDNLVGNKDLYKFENGQWWRNTGEKNDEGDYIYKEAGIANIIGDVLDNFVPNVNSVFGNAVNAIANKNYRYAVNKAGQLVKYEIDKNGEKIGEDISVNAEEFWSDMTSTIGNGISNLLDSGRDSFLSLFNSKDYVFNKKDNKWEKVTWDDSLDDIIAAEDATFFDALKGFLGEGSGGFVDKINEIVDNIFNKDNPDSLVNKIQNFSETARNWLDDYLGENWKFDEKSNSWLKDGKAPKPGELIKDLAGKTLGNILEGISPILQGWLGLQQDISDSTGGLWGALTNKFTEQSHEWGMAIAQALAPDDLRDWIEHNFETDSDFGLFDGLATGLKATLADIIDNLTGLTTDEEKSAVSKLAKGGSWGDIIKTLFTPEGSKGLGETVGSAIKNAFGGIGENILEFFSKGGKYEYVPGKGFYNQNAPRDSLTGEYTGEGRSFGGVLRDIVLDTLAPEGYHAYNGRYYTENEWEPSTGTPKTDNGNGTGTPPTGASAAAVGLAGMYSTMFGEEFTAVGDYVYRKSDIGEDGLPTGNPFKLVDELGSIFGANLYQGLIGALPSGIELYEGLTQLFGEDSFVGNLLNGEITKLLASEATAHGFTFQKSKSGGQFFTDKDGKKYKISDIKAMYDNGWEEFTTEDLYEDLYNTFKENWTNENRGPTGSDFADFLRELGYSDKEREELIKLYEDFEAKNNPPEEEKEEEETSEKEKSSVSSPADEAAVEDSSPLDVNKIKQQYNSYLDIIGDNSRNPQSFVSWAKDVGLDTQGLNENQLNTIINLLKTGNELTQEQVDYIKESSDVKEGNVKYNSETGQWENDKGEKVETDENGVPLPQDQSDITEYNNTGNYSGNTGDNPSGTPGSTPGSTQGSAPGSTPGTSTQTSNGLNPKSLGESISNFVTKNANNGKYAGNGVTIGGQNYDYVKDSDGGVIGFTDPSTGQSYDLSGNPMIEESAEYAIGKNNSILQFAAGREGHMAVTGELGPELTIREDGSVDMLGRRGREYAWVNPGDIIYTAAQTASILGNNNIAWLDGFSKGFNNRIRAYSIGDMYREGAGNANSNGDTWTPGNTYGGSGGNGSVSKAAYSGGMMGAMMGMEEAVEEDPRYNMYTLKERDIITRYYTILQQLDDITREIEHFGKQADRSWGEEKIQAIERQTDAYKEQYQYYQKYMGEIEQYLKTDQDALTLMIKEFARDFKEKTGIEIFGGQTSQSQQRQNPDEGSQHVYGLTQYGGNPTPSRAIGQNNNIIAFADGTSEQEEKKRLEQQLEENRARRTEQISMSNSFYKEQQIDLMTGMMPQDTFVQQDTSGQDAALLRDPINWISAEYDLNGVLTNYQEIVERMIQVYNENAEAFAQDKEAQYKFQEMLKDIQFYTDSLNLYESQKEVLNDLKNAILDNQIRKIVYQISYENELDNNALKEINYNFEKIRDNAYRSADAIDYYATKMEYLDKSNERYKEGIKDILATYSGNITNGIQNQIMLSFYRKAPMKGYDIPDPETPELDQLGIRYDEFGMPIQGGSEGFSNPMDGIRNFYKNIYTENYETTRGAVEAATAQVISNIGKNTAGVIQQQSDVATETIEKVAENTANDIGRATFSEINRIDDTITGVDSYFNSKSWMEDYRYDFMNGVFSSKEEKEEEEENTSTLVTKNGVTTDTEKRKRYKGTPPNKDGITPPRQMDYLDETLSSKRFMNSNLFYNEGMFGPENSPTLMGQPVDEYTELPYFPTDQEVEEYFKNFTAVQIGEETYYVPKSADIEIRDDMVQPIDITRAIVNNKGQLTKDEKDLITAQVKAWYDELTKVAPELAANIKPIYQDGFMTNFREVLNAINDANAQMSNYMYDLLINDTEEFFKRWSEITVNNADFQDLTTETAAQLENMIDIIYANLQQKEKYIDTIISTLGNDIKTFNKELNAQIDEFDFYNEILSNYENIINLTNRRSTNIGNSFMSNLRDSLLDNAINKISGTKTVYDTMRQMYNGAKETYDLAKEEFENYRNELLKNMTAEEAAQDQHYQYLEDRLDQVQDKMDIANSKLEDSNKQFLKAWEDALSKIQSDYSAAVQDAARTLEESFSPLFNTFDLLQAEFERQKNLEDYYLDDYQRIHDLNALDRSIEQSILDTDNLKSKARLRDMQKEINNLMDEGTELSAYDLDILQKKYDIELARQALEDAKEAKSVVRLSRDNNGNWSYIYTSDDQEIEEAEQNYENAIRDMEEVNENYIDNLEAQIIQVQQAAEQAILNLSPEDFATYDEYLAAVAAIHQNMYTTLDYLREQLNHAFGNNEWLDPVIIDRYGKNDHNLTDGWDKMTLAAVSGINSLDDAVGIAKDNLQDMIGSSLEAFEEYSKKQSEVYATAGADIKQASEYFNLYVNETLEESNQRVETTENLANRVGDAFAKTAEKVRDFNKDIFDLTAEYEKLNSVMIKFLEISGEYVPEEKLDFVTAIDTYKEIDEIKQVLGKYGKILVTDYDEKGNRRIYNLEENTETTAKQFEEWYELAAKNDEFDVGDDLDEKEEYEKINNYLEEHGQVYVSIDGELKKLSKNNEEDMAWLKEKLDAIEKEEDLLNRQSMVEDPFGMGLSGAYPDYMGNAEIYDSSFGREERTVNINWNENEYQSSRNIDQLRNAFEGVYGDTGLYTGEWSGGSEHNNGRLAWLHQKELVLNEQDTENFLNAINIVRQLDNLTSWMANGLGDLFTPNIKTGENVLEQNVHIDASFPNVSDHNEIEEAFGNLVNLASQYANRKSFT